MDDWRLELLQRNGKTTSGPYNVMKILENDEIFNGLCYDTSSHVVIDMLSALPWKGHKKYELFWNELDYSYLFMYLTIHYGIEPSNKTMSRAVYYVAKSREVDLSDWWED